MLEKNTNLIIGKIDSGKTRGVLLKEANKSIENNENLLFLDNKKEYYATYARDLKEKGYNVLIFNLQDPTKTNGWNPLSLPYQFYKEKKTDIAVDLINKLALEIFKSDNSTADPFWENTSADFFTGVVLTLFKEGKEEEINLGSVGMMITTGEKKIDDTFIIKKYAENLDPLNIAYVSMSSTVFAPNETRGSILSVIKQKINLFLMREQLLNALNTNEIELYNIKNKTAIFIIGKSDSTNYLANILINQIIFMAGKNRIRFTFVLDNFETLPKLLELGNLIENATYNGFKVNVAIKDKSEMISKYGEFIANRFANTIEINEDVDLLDVGNYDNYPELKMAKHNYFNLEKLLKNTNK